jgi:hypothetical protein
VKDGRTFYIPHHISSGTLTFSAATGEGDGEREDQIVLRPLPPREEVRPLPRRRRHPESLQLPEQHLGERESPGDLQPTGLEENLRRRDEIALRDAGDAVLG